MYTTPHLIAKLGGVPRTEFRLIPFGRVETDGAVRGGDFTFSRAHAEQAVKWFNSLGRRLAIDYEHQSIAELNRRHDGLVPAAGWIGALEIRGDGLWATRVEWTSTANELLSLGEYRYFSPVIYWTDDKQTALKALGPVALSNDPAIKHIEPLVAMRLQQGIATIYESSPEGPGATNGDSGMDEIASLLGLKPGATVKEIIAVVKKLVGGGPLPSEKEDAEDAAAAMMGSRASLGQVAAWRAIYRSSHALQSEFGSEDVFLAFKRAEANGQVQILRR